MRRTLSSIAALDQAAQIANRRWLHECKGLAAHLSEYLLQDHQIVIIVSFQVTLREITAEAPKSSPVINDASLRSMDHHPVVKIVADLLSNYLPRSRPPSASWLTEPWI